MNDIIGSALIVLLIWIIASSLTGIILEFFYDSEVFLEWYDVWIGIYYDKDKKILYINPLPTMVFKFDLNERKRYIVKRSNMRTEKEIREQLDIMYEEKKRISREVSAGTGEWRRVTQYIYGLEYALGVDKEE